MLSAAPARAQNAAKLVSAQGMVEREQPPWVPIPVNTWLPVGTTVRTGADSRAVLLLVDETQLKVNSNTAIQLTGVRAATTLFQRVALAANRSQESVISVAQGQVWLRARTSPANVKVTTPAVTAAIRGTEFDLSVAADGESVLTVLEGSVDFRNDLGAVLVGSGEQGRVRVGQAPTKSILVNPTDAVQWTLLYTSALSPRDNALDGAPADSRQRIQQAQLGLLNGDPAQARAALEGIAAADPAYTLAQSLLANVYLVQNRNDEARRAAERAVTANPESPSAHLALSFVEQSAFNLPAATRAAERARQLDPDFVQTNVQYARLLFGAGESGQAERVLRGVVAAAPQDGPAHAALGFVLLARGRNRDARASLETALMLDSAQGEPHLGLGILSMREGQYEEAVAEFVTAAAVEPQRSQYQTYLAKALYELRRFDQAFGALAAAEALDPQDPTPHLYAGIFHNDLLRPGEAVREFEESMRLNDGRAVYRSRFLLDEDQATRNVKLATAYDALGFTEWANLHAITSEFYDSSNSGAHQFLADTFLNLPGRLSAGGGELLLARLLKPANANSFNAFNDYTTLFDRPRANWAATLSAGSFAAANGTVNASGGTSRIAYSALWDYTRTDGFRPANDDRHTATGANLLKIALTPHSDVLLSYVHLNSHQGDHGGTLVSNVNNPFRRVTSILDRVEAGYHQQFAPGSDLVLFVSRAADTGIAEDPHVDEGLWHTVTTTHAPYYSYQGTHLLKLGHAQLRYGFDVFNGQSQRSTDTWLVLSRDPLVELPTPTEHTDGVTRYRTLFAQASYAVSPRLAVTAGINHDWSNHDDFFQESDRALSRRNPNAGVLFSPVPSTTFRFAAMQVLQTDYQDRLVPTHVVGFPTNQNEFALVQSTAYNAGWDQRFGGRTFLRTLAYTRESETPLGSLCDLVNCAGRFHGARVVLNQFLTGRWTFVPEYSLTSARDLFGERRDHEAVAGLFYVSPRGFAFSMREHYFNQHGLTVDAANDTSVFTTNAAFSYELPRRRGQLSLVVNNLTDRRYRYLADPLVLDPRVPRRQVTFIMRVNM